MTTHPLFLTLVVLIHNVHMGPWGVVYCEEGSYTAMYESSDSITGPVHLQPHQHSYTPR